MRIICEKCKKEFDTSEGNIKLKKTKRITACPACGRKYELFRSTEKEFTRLENGQLIRKNKKVRMSKKDRLKLRRENAKIST